MIEGGLVFDRRSATAIDVRDTFSNQQYQVRSSEPFDAWETSFESSPGPVTDALELDAVDLIIPASYGATIRDETSEMDAHFGFDGGTYAVDGGTRFIEFHTPVRAYLRIDGPFEYTHTEYEIRIDLSRAGGVVLGARAWQCYPEETITISESSSDLRTAISHFGDAMLTTSPERSFPTLRGHPPLLRVGETLDVPESLSRPDTGITLTVPPTTSNLLTVAPLAYYLLATVEPGDQFGLETDTGFSYRPDSKSISDAVQSILTHCFYLDCLVRTEGLYPVDLQERRDFEAVAPVELDYSKLYNQSLSERTERYLQVPADIVVDVMPTWPVTAFVDSDTPSTEALPYLVYELANIRPTDPPRYTGEMARGQLLEVLSQYTGEKRSTSLVFENEAEFVDIPETNGQQTIWVGDGVPLNASKFVQEGFENHSPVFDQTDPSATDDTPAASTGGLEITVVCNDRTMARETVDIQEAIDPRDDLPLELSTYSQVPVRKLREILETGTDYLHYVGHATPHGLECPDGVLDVRTIDETNVELFFLNACQSFQQGTHLVEQGSSGGIVTYSDVSEKYALEVGGLIGRLLNAGFPIGACRSIVRDTTSIGGHYTTVGNHTGRLTQPPGGAPFLSRITEQGERYEITVTSYASGAPRYLVGIICGYTLAGTRKYLVTSSETFEVDKAELVDYLSTYVGPVVFEGRLQTKADFFDAIDADL